MGGGASNKLYKIILNPASQFLPDKYSWFADPAGQMTTQSIFNIYDWFTGEQKVGTAKDWWGTGEGGWGNHTMRKWTEGKSYKKWDTWKQEQAVEYEKNYAELRESNKQKTQTPATQTKRKVEPQQTSLLEDEQYPTTSYLT